MARSTLPRFCCALTLALLAVPCTSALAGSATITFLPEALSANDMSPDGRYVVGDHAGGGGYIYDTVLGVMTVLPPPATGAVAVSDDGTSVVGSLVNGSGLDVAAIWRQSTNQWESLGYLDSCDAFASSPYELDGDGSVAVGLTWDGCSGLAFAWTPGGGMVGLESLGNGGNRASVVSGSGAVIGGFAQGSFDRTPAIWGLGGQGKLLDPSGNATGEVYGINDGGTILLGSLNGKAVMWTEGGATVTQLGGGSVLPGWTGIPMDIANNGSVVGFDFLSGNRRAWIRPGTTGPLVDLKTYLEANGADVPEEVLLEVCQAISTDGSKIIGHGFASGPWLVSIEPPNVCVADIAPAGGDGAVDGADLASVLGAWGGPAGDLDGDGTTDGADLAIVLGGWGACPAPLGACCLDGECSQLTASECALAGGVYVGDYVPCSLSACVNNDACADAIDITANIDGALVNGDNSTATPTFGGPDPDMPAGSPSCQWNGNPTAAHSSVWFSFTSPTIAIRLELCESVSAPFTDSTISLYAGECGSLVEIGCDEDSCEPAGSYPYYSWLYVDGLTPGETYYVCVTNSGDWAGSVPGPFKLSINTP